VKEKPTVGSPFFGAFPSAHIPKATEDVYVPYFIHSNNSCKFYYRIPGTFWRYYILKCILEIKDIWIYIGSMRAEKL